MQATAAGALPPSPKKNQYLGVDPTTGLAAWTTSGSAAAAAAHSNGATYVASKAGTAGMPALAQGPTFSVAMLVRTNQNDKVLWSWGQLATGRCCAARMRAETPCYGIDFCTQGAGLSRFGADVVPPVQLDDGNWHLVVLSLTGGGAYQCTAYIDGSAAAPVAITQGMSPQDNGAGLLIGDANVGIMASSPLTGDFSRFAMFAGTALSAANVATLYAAMQSSQATFDAAVAALSASIYYHFDESAGTNVVDSAGANDATYSGAATPAGATTSPFPSAIVAPLPNLMTGQGDIEVAGPGGVPARLARGVLGNYLHVNAATGALEWATALTPAAGASKAFAIAMATALGG